MTSCIVELLLPEELWGWEDSLELNPMQPAANPKALW